MDKKPHRTPEAIPVIGPIGHTLSSREQAAILYLKKDIFKCEEKLGLNFSGLRIYADNPNNCGFGISNFGVRVPESGRNPVFAANIHTAVGALTHIGSLEGVTFHEGMHVLLDNFDVKENLKNTIGMLEQLGKVEKNLVEHPVEAQAEICSKYGSMENFEAKLIEFDKYLNKRITACAGFLKLYNSLDVTPDALARLMEDLDIRYLKLKTTFKTPLYLPWGNGDTDYRRTAFPSPGHKNTQNSDVLNAIGDIMEVGKKVQLLNTLLSTFSNAEECAADEGTRQTSEDRGASLMEFLRWYEESGLPRDRLNHPSPSMRIERLKRNATQPDKPKFMDRLKEKSASDIGQVM